MHAFKKFRTLLCRGRKHEAAESHTLYTAHTLHTISLADFEEVLLGENRFAIRSGVSTKEQASRAAAELVTAYSEITGGKRAASLLRQRDRLVRLEMRLVALEAAKMLAEAGDVAGSRKVLKDLHISIPPKATSKQAAQAAKANAARDRMQRDLLQGQLDAEEKARETDGEKLTRGSLAKERVAVGKYAKMHIDTRSFTAAEYAYLVQAMNEEYEAVKKATEQTKRRKR